MSRHIRTSRGVSRLALVSALMAAGLSAPVFAQSDDTVTISTSDTVTASIDGGEGYDTVIVDGDGRLELDTDFLLNFEVFEKTGAGDLFLTGSSAGQVWTVDGGRTTIGAGAVIGGVETGLLAQGADGTMIRNFGTVTSAGGGTGTLALYADGAIVRNRGSIVDGAMGAVGEGAEVTNWGDITTTVWGATALSGAGADVVVTNHGSVTASGDYSTGLLVSGARGQGLNTGTISVAGNRSTAVSVTGDFSGFVNTGTVSSEEIGITITGDSATVANTGNILITSDETAESGIALEGDSGNITNSGLILVGGDEDTEVPTSLYVNGVSLDGDFNTLVNSGDIGAGGRYANAVEASGDGNQIFNSGRIQAAGEDAIGVNLIGVAGSPGLVPSDIPQAGETTAMIENSGRIIGGGTGGIGVRMGGVDGNVMLVTNLEGGVIGGDAFGISGEEGDDYVVNHGHIGSDGVAVSLGAGNDRLDNYGSITGLDGAVDLGSGDDLAFFYGGSTYSGLIDGGDDWDEFTVGGEGSFTLTMSDVVNFERLAVAGNVALTLQGEGSDQSWEVEGGTVTIADGATVDSVFETGFDTATVLVNNGTVTGGLGVAGDGDSLTNNGVITLAGFGGVGMSSVGGENNILINAGAVTHSGDRGIGLALAGDGSWVQNTGLVVTEDVDYGVSIDVDGDSNAVINSGSVLAGNVAIDIDGDENALSNSGTIVTSHGSAFSAALMVEGDRNSIENEGDILAGFDGVSGATEGVRYARGLTLEGSDNVLVNSGSLGALGQDAQALDVTGSGNSVLNTGLILAQGEDAVGIWAWSGVDGGSAAMIGNDGQILATGSGSTAIRLASDAGQSYAVTNGSDGEIRADGVAIIGGEGSETITNAGLIAGGEGSMALGGGDDELVLYTSYALEGIADGGDGLDLVTLTAFDAAATGVYNFADFTNFEQLSVENGVWSFTGNGTFGLLDVALGSTLGGTATLNGDVLVDGTLAPGNSIGTLTVNGNVTLSASSTYSAEVNGAGRSDLLDVSGNITLEGGTLEIVPLAGAYSIRTTYTLMTAGGMIDGSFGNVVTSADFNPYVAIGSDTVELTLVRDIDFAAAATSDNGRMAGAALSGALAPDMDQDLVDAMDGLMSLEADSRADALAHLSGETYATQAMFNLDQYSTFDRAVADRMQAPHSGAGAWMEGVVRSARVDDTAQQIGVTQDTTGLVGGYGWTAGPDQVVGVSFAWLGANASAHVDHVDTSSKAIGAYATSRMAGFEAGVQAGWMSHEGDVTRRLPLGAASREVTAEFGGDVWGASVDVARPLSDVLPGGGMIRPDAGVSFASLNVDSVAETGGDTLSLSGEVADVESLVARIGAAAVWSDNEDLFASVRVGWAEQLADDETVLNAQYDGIPSTSLSTTSAHFGGDGLEFDASASVLLNERIRLRVGYEAVFGDDHDTQSFRGGVSVRF